MQELPKKNISKFWVKYKAVMYIKVDDVLIVDIINSYVFGTIS